jgi:hypothetical protein
LIPKLWNLKRYASSKPRGLLVLTAFHFRGFSFDLIWVFVNFYFEVFFLELSFNLIFMGFFYFRFDLALFNACSYSVWGFSLDWFYSIFWILNLLRSYSTFWDIYFIFWFSYLWRFLFWFWVFRFIEIFILFLGFKPIVVFILVLDFRVN